MASAPQEQLIGEFRYIVTPLTGRKSIHALTRLGKLFTTAVSVGAQAREAGNDGSAMMAGLAKALEFADDATVDYLIDTFAPTTTVVLSDTKQPQLSAVFDVHFQGRALDMVEWLFFAVKVNFSDFFGGLGAINLPGSPVSPTPTSAP